MEHIDLEFQTFQSTIFYNNYFLNNSAFFGAGGGGRTKEMTFINK